jgi:hypothetical protein
MPCLDDDLKVEIDVGYGEGWMLRERLDIERSLDG